MNDDSYVELLAMLCRKGWGGSKIQRCDQPDPATATIAEEYEAEERRIKDGNPTKGDFGTEARGGKLAIFCVPLDGSKPWTMWIAE